MIVGGLKELRGNLQSSTRKSFLAVNLTCELSDM